MSTDRRRSETFALLAVALACFGCARGRSVVQVTLDMDRDRWELPHTAERVTLRRSDDMVVRVRLVNSSDQPLTVEIDQSSAYIWGIDHRLFRGEEMLMSAVTSCRAGGSKAVINPGESAFHDIHLSDYSAPDRPLPAGEYRIRIMFTKFNSMREFPLLDKWVELEIK